MEEHTKRANADKYESRFARDLEKHMMGGKSFDSFYCGVSRSTKYNWLNEIPEWREVYDKCNAAIQANFESIGYAISMGLDMPQPTGDKAPKIGKPNPKMIQFFLAHRFWKTYSTKVETTISNPDGSNVIPPKADLSKLSATDLKAMKEILKKAESDPNT